MFDTGNRNIIPVEISCVHSKQIYNFIIFSFIFFIYSYYSEMSVLYLCYYFLLSALFKLL